MPSSRSSFHRVGVLAALLCALVASATRTGDFSPFASIKTTLSDTSNSAWKVCGPSGCSAVEQICGVWGCTETKNICPSSGCDGSNNGTAADEEESPEPAFGAVNGQIYFPRDDKTDHLIPILPACTKTDGCHRIVFELKSDIRRPRISLNICKEKYCPCTTCKLVLNYLEGTQEALVYVCGPLGCVSAAEYFGFDVIESKRDNLSDYDKSEL